MTKSKWEKTSFPGVRFRKHATRKHGITSDKYFTIRHSTGGKKTEEGLGWASEGMTAKKAFFHLSALKEAHKTGQGAQSMAEKREQKQAETEEKARNDLTFEDFFYKIYFPRAQASKKKRSYNTELSLFKHWIEPIIGKLTFENIAPLHLERIKSNMVKAEKSSATQRYALAVVSQVWNLARRDKIVSGDSPTKQVKIRKVDNRRIRFLSLDEAETLLAELEENSEQLHDMALLSLHSGLRAGEIFNLTWDCLDPDRGTMVLKDTKSGRNRAAFMTKKVAAMLYRRKGDQTNGYIFKTRGGEKIKEISNAFAVIIDKIGFNKGVSDPRDKVVFHTLRHTYASWLVEKGVALYIVKELMGHSTLVMTERYSHVSPRALEEAVRKLDEESFKDLSKLQSESIA
ncbi:MAG: tyrosine-type recombinase/integrase [Gemmatimonadota bacterium]|nr:tyrosine-type recombinase/integrase [Gemmatimonadota bacterium]